MNILLGSSSPVDQGAGINTYVKEIAAEMYRRNHKIFLIAPKPNEIEWLKTYHVQLLVADQFSEPVAKTAELLTFINKFNIHGIINNDNPFLQSVAPLVNCVYISVVHLGFTNIASLACFNNTYIDHIVAISNDMRYRLIEKFNIENAKISLVYNGIADPISKQPFQQRTHHLPLNLIYAGGSNCRKGFNKISEMILAASPLKSKVEFHLYGSYDQKIIDDFASNNMVYIHGRVNRKELLNKLNEGGVFLLPSEYEGCPMALIEAMAFGMVPLVSDGDGAMDVMVESGVNGFVIQRSDWVIQSIAAIEVLLKSADRFALMSSISRAQFEQRFSVQHTVHNLISLLQNPVIDRQVKPESVSILRWHRPTKLNSNVAPIIDRLCYKFGFLRVCKRLMVTELLNRSSPVRANSN